MGAKIKFMRRGSKKRPFYRVIVIDESAAPQHGQVIEILGNYRPQKPRPLISLNEERIGIWLKQGADPTPAVKKLLVKQGIVALSAAEQAMLAKRYAQAQAKSKQAKEGATEDTTPAADAPPAEEKAGERS